MTVMIDTHTHTNVVWIDKWLLMHLWPNCVRIYGLSLMRHSILLPNKHQSVHSFVCYYCREMWWNFFFNFFLLFKQNDSDLFILCVECAFKIFKFSLSIILIELAFTLFDTFMTRVLWKLNSSVLNAGLIAFGMYQCFFFCLKTTFKLKMFPKIDGWATINLLNMMQFFIGWKMKMNAYHLSFKLYIVNWERMREKIQSEKM